MRKLLLLFYMSILIVGLTSCRIQKTLTEVKTLDDIRAQHPGSYIKIAPEKAKAFMDLASKDHLYEDGSVIILDVRTPAEYAAGHIPRAINLPNETIETAEPAILPDLNTVIMVYCRTGVRSRDASEKLIALGYKYVFDFGGIADWPYEVETA